MKKSAYVEQRKLQKTLDIIDIEHPKFKAIWTILTAKLGLCKNNVP